MKATACKAILVNSSSEMSYMYIYQCEKKMVDEIEGTASKYYKQNR
jgi:hypothetical protein